MMTWPKCPTDSHLIILNGSINKPNLIFFSYQIWITSICVHRSDLCVFLMSHFSAHMASCHDSQSAPHSSVKVHMEESNNSDGSQWRNDDISQLLDIYREFEGTYPNQCYTAMSPMFTTWLSHKLLNLCMSCSRGSQQCSHRIHATTKHECEANIKKWEHELKCESRHMFSCFDSLMIK